MSGLKRVKVFKKQSLLLKELFFKTVEVICDVSAILTVVLHAIIII